MEDVNCWSFWHLEAQNFASLTLIAIVFGALSNFRRPVSVGFVWQTLASDYPNYYLSLQVAKFCASKLAKILYDCSEAKVDD